MELISLGGPVVVGLLCLSALGFAVVLFKLLQYARYSGALFRRADRALTNWVTGGGVKHEGMAVDRSSAYLKLLFQGMAWLEAGRDPQQVREELSRQGQSILAKVTALNGFVEQIAYLAPLCGLLGTVLGMIDVFQGLANTSTSAAETGALAGGIWEALLTTAVGLTVAIPFALMHAALEGRANKIRKRMEDQMTRLFTIGLYQTEPRST